MFFMFPVCELSASINTFGIMGLTHIRCREALQIGIGAAWISYTLFSFKALNKDASYHQSMEKSFQSYNILYFHFQLEYTLFFSLEFKPLWAKF